MQSRPPESLEHAGLVHWFARRYRGRSGSLDYEDLVGYAWIGVLEACRRRDPERAARFPSYLATWIRKEILEAIRHRSMMVHIPDHLQRAGRRPPHRDAGFRVAEVAGPPPRLDAAEWGSVVDALDRLDARARQVIERHFGLRGPAEPLTAIAADLQIPLARARWIKEHALDRLRKSTHGEDRPPARV